MPCRQPVHKRERVHWSDGLLILKRDCRICLTSLVYYVLQSCPRTSRCPHPRPCRSHGMHIVWRKACGKSNAQDSNTRRGVGSPRHHAHLHNPSLRALACWSARREYGAVCTQPRRSATGTGSRAPAAAPSLLSGSKSNADSDWQPLSASTCGCVKGR